MNIFLFRFSRLISLIFHTISVCTFLGYAYLYIVTYPNQNIEWMTVAQFIFFLIILPQFSIIIFNWLSFGKITLWIKAPREKL